MMQMAHVIKCTLTKQVRNSNYLFILMLSIFFGFLCVPSISSGYEIFDLGGVRGVYNSHWLGGLATILPVIILWLPGFYLLRSQVSDDKKLKIDQLIASSPIKKTQYIGVKLLCNFIILLSFALLFTLSIMGMQVFHGESKTIQLSAYFIPFLVLTVPHLLVLSACTVLFDVVDGMKGAIGNIAIFVVWLLLTMLSLERPGSFSDMFGMGMILNTMQADARAVFPAISDSASFGYYTHNGTIPTFVWEGISFQAEFIWTRVFWILVVAVLFILSVVVFDRFRKVEYRATSEKKKHTVIKQRPPAQLLPVKKGKRINWITLIKGEFQILFTGATIWWGVAVVAAIIISFFVARLGSLQWVSLIMLLPMGVWAQMGCREKIYGTADFISSSSSKVAKWIATLVAGGLSAVLMSGGVLLGAITSGKIDHAVAWLMGALFTTTLALFCGRVSGERRLFEGIYIVLLYFGPINDMWVLDFLGVQTQNTVLYVALTAGLIVAGMAMEVLPEKRFFRKLT